MVKRWGGGAGQGGGHMEDSRAAAEMLNDSPAWPPVTSGQSAHISEPQCPGS